MTRQQDLAFIDFLDLLTDPVSGGPRTRALVGGALPIGLLLFAGYLFVTLPTTIHLTLPANHRTPSQTVMTSSPHARYAICLIVASLASYFHFRWYWGLHPLLCDATPFVTKLALAAVGLSIGYLGVVLFMTS